MSFKFLEIGLTEGRWIEGKVFKILIFHVLIALGKNVTKNTQRFLILMQSIRIVASFIKLVSLLLDEMADSILKKKMLLSHFFILFVVAQAGFEELWESFIAFSILLELALLKLGSLCQNLLETLHSNNIDIFNQDHPNLLHSSCHRSALTTKPSPIPPSISNSLLYWSIYAPQSNPQTTYEAPIANREKQAFSFRNNNTPVQGTTVYNNHYSARH